MYLDHYQLTSKPFSLSPGPKFLWLGEKHKEALATLNYGILEDLGFLLLTGDVGVGKTALIHRLISNLDSSTIIAHITDPGVGTIDFFKLLAVEFNIPIEFHGKGEFLIELEKFLYAAYSDHKKVLLVVDEAQRLNNKLLDQIRVLSNIELSDRKLINIFFVGQPEFKTLLMANSNRAIRQRIAINYHIQPLTESETGQYIEHRLKVAGAPRQIFKPNAIREIFRFTGGFPRSINVICDHALVTGYASGLQSIDSAVIEECEQELSIRAGFEFSWTDFQKPTAKKQPETRPPAPRRSASMVYPILIGLFIVMGALVSYYLLWPGPRWTMTPNSQSKMAGAPNRQMESIVKDQNQTATNNEIVPQQPYKIDNFQRKTALEKEMAAVDREPALSNDPVNPRPDPISDKRPVDSGVIIPDQAEKSLASLSVPSDTESKIQIAKTTPNAEITKQTVSKPKDKTAASDRQPPIFIAQAKPAPDPLPYISMKDSDVTGTGKAGADTAAAAALAAGKPELQADPDSRKETVTQIAPPARKTDTGSNDQAAVPSDKASPKADPSTDTPSVEGPVTASGKAAAAMVAALAAKPKPKADPVPRKETVAQKTPPARKADNVADGQTAVTAKKPAPKAEPPTDTPAVESDTTSSGKASADAAAVAALAAKPEPKADPIPRKETVAQNTPPARKADDVIDDQAAVPAAKPAPKADPSTDPPAVKRDATAVAVLAAAKPGSPVKPATSVGNASANLTTDTLKPSNTQNPRVIESASQATVSPAKAAAEETPVAEEVPSDNRLEASLAAKTETPPQSSSEVAGVAIASGEQLDANLMENRLRSFLQTYCNTYAAKDLDRFANFFATNAMENGKPFDSLVPTYERNFKFIETIEYRIELQDFWIAEDRQLIKIGGDFFLKWLPPDKQWRENSGKISMSLKDNGSSFLVQRLDYQGSSSKKK